MDGGAAASLSAQSSPMQLQEIFVAGGACASIVGLLIGGSAMQIQHPYLLFLGDAPDQLAAKTAQGIAQWRRDWCLGQLRLAGCKADLGLPELTLQQAVAEGARTLISASPIAAE